MPAPAPALERLGWAQRSVALLGAVGALAIAAGAVSAMLSGLYSSLAFDLLRSPTGRDGGDQAAARAVVLAPWRAEAHARQADARLLRKDLAGAASANARRLRWAPGDPHAWLQRAALMRQSGRFDDELLGAYRIALERAPQSPSLHYVIALHALYDWNAGDEALQSIWASSTARVLRRGQRHFLLQVVRRRRDEIFCAYAPTRIPDATRWCSTIGEYRAACAGDRLSPAQLAWCAEMGLDPERQRAR